MFYSIDDQALMPQNTISRLMKEKAGILRIFSLVHMPPVEVFELRVHMLPLIGL